MASIRKRSWTSRGETKTAWVVDYRDQHGKRHLKTFDKKKDADAWKRTALFEVDQGTHTADSASVTVGFAGDKWIETAEADGLESATVRQYRSHLELHIRPYLGDTKLSQLTVPMVREFADKLERVGRPATDTERVAGLEAVPVARPTVQKVVSSLGSLIADAQERGLVSRNVVREMRPRRRGKADKRHKAVLKVGVDIPSPDEIKAILAAADAIGGRARAMVNTAVFTGLRASELRGLPWEAVDFDNRTINVYQRADELGQIGSPKSEAGWRKVPMTPKVLNALKEWKLACPRRGVVKDADGSLAEPGELVLVFPNGKGNVESHANVYRRVFGAVQLAAGVSVDTHRKDKDGNPIKDGKYGVHAFRHFFASWILAEKDNGGLEVSPKRAQALLGHSSIQMTMDTYGHLLPSRRSEANAFAEAEGALLAF